MFYYSVYIFIKIGYLTKNSYIYYFNALLLEYNIFVDDCFLYFIVFDEYTNNFNFNFL